MHLSSLEKEKVSVKLLYLFEPSFVNHHKVINEAKDETGSKSFSKNFIDKILSAVGKFMAKFSFIVVIVFLLALITVEYDIFMLIAKALGMAVGRAYIGKKTSQVTSGGVDFFTGKYNKDGERIKDILTKNNFKEINFDETEFRFGSCVQVKNEKNETVNKKISVKDAIVILTKSKDKETAKEANSIYEDIMLSAKGKVKRKFSAYNWFGLKNILTYLQKKAETIQGYLSSLVKLIISIFSSKNLNESKKMIKKQLKKIIFFNENYLKNKKENIIFNENYIYPSTKKRLKNIIATFTTNDNKELKINTINKTITADKDLLKKIFNNNSIESDIYSWDKKEYILIKSFIENNVSNKKNQVVSTNKEQNTEENDVEKTDLSQSETNNKKTNLSQSETDDKNLQDLNKVDTSKPSVFSFKIINSMINSSIAKYLIIGLIVIIAVLGTATTMGGSAAAEKAKFAAEAAAEASGLSAEAIAEAGQKAAETAMNEAKGGNFMFFIQKCIKWLGWPASFGAGLTYGVLKGHMEKLTAGELSQTIKNVEKNSDAKNTINDGIEKVKKMVNEDESREKKEGFLSKTVNKVKNIFGSKKETVNDSYQYIRNKPEILYNEDYIMNEYFKIENKIKRSHS
jgi:hypothetical protein